MGLAPQEILAQQEFTWIGPYGNWEDAANWDPSDQGPPSGDVTVIITGGEVSISGDKTVKNLELHGGLIIGDHDVAVTEQLTWNGGGFWGSGTTTIQKNASIGGDGKSLSRGRIVENLGTLTWAGGTIHTGWATIYNRPGAEFKVLGAAGLTNGLYEILRFYNQGTFVVDGLGNAVFGGDAFGSEGFGFFNSGTVDIRSGALRLWDSGTTAGESSGLFQIGTSGELELKNSPNTFTTSSRILNGGIVRVTGGSHRFEGTYTSIDENSKVRVEGGIADFAMDTLRTPVLTVSGGTLAGSAVVVAEVLRWSGGAMSGTGTTILGPVTSDPLVVGSIVESAGKGLLNGRTLINRGDLVWSGGDITVYSGSGTFINEAGAEFLISSPGGNFNHSLFESLIIQNYGRIVRDSTGVVVFGSDAWPGPRGIFNNAGEVVIQKGTLAIHSFGDVASRASGLFDVKEAGTLEFRAGSYAIDEGASLVNNGSVVATGGR
ncbi:MAG: hypothetical protein R3178_03680, partial [Rhodothermales bacterium]|nr:hypothetical protein [Rhodothermales bacterium]